MTLNTFMKIVTPYIKGKARSPHLTGFFAVRMSFLIAAKMQTLTSPLNNGEINHDKTIEPTEKKIRAIK